MQRKQVTKIKLWLLEQLDLSNVNVLQWEDGLGALLDLSANSLWDQLTGQLSQGGVRNFSGHNFHHLLSDLLQFRRLSVSGLLDLVGLSFGESNAEHSQNVVIRGLDSNISLHKRLPFSNKRLQLVGGEIHTVEVGQKVLTLNLVNSQLDLLVRVVLGTLQVSKTNLDNSTLKTVSSVLQTTALVDQGLSNVSVFKGGWGLDVVPFLSGEWVDNPLLDTFLSLGQSLVLSDSHVV
ncbi:hypothetical protein OGAPHI_003904 [Ogataea philodendri]|uniref:Uncharacterized protein n=1 Tax=Ogataea philodendri TaxID=1378263 RepID=A0A9P8T4H1_9ASCO|nr:uncharacterized protein OGAPHI_003904 [Ogataea philodendri]KAH3665716.1 hypothetical protein OGAPHI_003904 [Ogataea philodendri]